MIPLFLNICSSDDHEILYVNCYYVRIVKFIVSRLYFNPKVGFRFIIYALILDINKEKVYFIGISTFVKETKTIRTKNDFAQKKERSMK
jgi:hypothetical protein